ncbi:LysR family transcriptional regulator [Paraburkholderia nemoris]|uniref:HTH-type transcriptional regulator PgrR n=1 Tax=Paraburkholderia nemoris TaxID=2793076 RepID=A0ABM8QGI3_9BURK|nr:MULTISPECIES: LysR family transcriptional regulator [Paraburkholderia]KPD15630.1 LysR family transcriptional regulator [Burkholderia sp. ST111]MBK3813750.1 LysR family transcriptional regulator [Paraburkholderia aspalathi]CAE6695548.1 HTH-type transcriptional regulator PgrR [Paraburkholderia nemoris]CAE6794462.1 HTH-type transcriptional regulator PgrR [Paraburkholderia nemoris]
MTKPTLADLTAFSAVATHRSFRRAADALGVSRSSLSHAMLALERELGVRLLNRTTRSVSPTEAGEALLARLAPVLRDLDEALDAVADARGNPSGTLRINANEGAARLLLKTVVPRFLKRFPGMSLDLVAEGRLVDIVEQGFDAGVRLGESIPRDMVAVRISDDLRFVVVAAPSYLAGRTPLITPDDLRSHDCIRQRLPSGKRYRWEFRKHAQEVAIDVPGVLTLDHSGLMVEAASDGLGLAYVPESTARDWLDDGRLVTVLEDWCPFIPGLCLYYPGHRHVPAGLRAFIDVLR